MDACNEKWLAEGEIAPVTILIIILSALSLLKLTEEPVEIRWLGTKH